jgi:restriction system protein
VTYLEAAKEVLRQAGSPLRAEEIAKRAIAAGWLETSGKTPHATMNACLSVAVKKRGEESRFVRTAPSTFGLREWIATGVLEPAPEADEDDHKVRVPHYPTYAGVAAALPWMEEVQANTITGMQRSIAAQRGSPQENRDWTEPGTWIGDVLAGEEAAFATRLWEGTQGAVNPRHFIGIWLLSRRYGLLEENSDGSLQLSERGQEFGETQLGDVAREIDDGEGVLKILSLVAELGPAKKGVLLEPWRDFLAEVSKARSDSYASHTLWARLRNLRERGYVEFSGAAYSVTEAGLDWLGEDTESGAGGDAYQEIVSLSKAQKNEIREAIHELLYEMDPYAFEEMVARLMEGMGYDDTEVTPRGNDKGVDVVASIAMGITRVKEVIQVKRQRGNIQRPVLDALRGSLHRFQADRGTIITTSRFSKGTIDAAIEPGAAPITLIDGEKLVELLIEHGIGVRKKQVELWELNTSAFERDESEVAEIEE